MSTILELSGLSKRFGRLMAVNNVSMKVKTGEIKAVIGPNGAGKSTLFNLTVGMPVTSGRIYFKGIDITPIPAYKIPRLGLAKTNQTVSIFPTMSVEENVALAIYSCDAGARHIFKSSGALNPYLSKARETLRRVGLQSQSSQLASELSHGDKKRLEIAMALATKPALLLLDEPTSGMSPHESALMADLISSISEGLTILMIEHDIEIVLSLSDSVAVLHQGMVLAEGIPDEIEQNRDVQNAYLGGYR